MFVVVVVFLFLTNKKYWWLRILGRKRLIYFLLCSSFSYFSFVIFSRLLSAFFSSSTYLPLSLSLSSPPLYVCMIVSLSHDSSFSIDADYSLSPLLCSWMDHLAKASEGDQDFADGQATIGQCVCMWGGTTVSSSNLYIMLNIWE